MYGAVTLTTRDMVTMLSDLKSTIISLLEAGPRSNLSIVDVVQTEGMNVEISNKGYLILSDLKSTIIILVEDASDSREFRIS